jgi:hypothetical protein
MGPPSVEPLVALRLAAKGLRRSVGTTTLAVSILALAAPATFFSLLVGAIRPLPVPEGDRVARIDVVQPERDARPLALTLEDLSSIEGPANLGALGAFRVTSATIVDPSTPFTEPQLGGCLVLGLLTGSRQSRGRRTGGREPW